MIIIWMFKYLVTKIRFCQNELKYNSIPVYANIETYLMKYSQFIYMITD